MLLTLSDRLLGCSSLLPNAEQMQNVRFLVAVRKATVLAPNSKAFVSLSSYRLLNSLCGLDRQLGIYRNNRLIDNFIKSGQLDAALRVFDQMLERDAVSYNLFISGSGRCGYPTVALKFYREMVLQGIRETSYTFSSVLSVCTAAGLQTEGAQVHGRVISLGFDSNVFIGSSLVGLYMYLGYQDTALNLFEEMPERNLEAWNLTLRGLCELNKIDEPVRLYCRLKRDGIQPNGQTYCYLIRACREERFLREGSQLHCHAIISGFVESNVFVANALVDFYSACGSLIDAQKSFAALLVEDVISWNSIVAVHANNGLVVDAIQLFSKMQMFAKRPSVHSFLGLLNFCSEDEDIQLGKQIHCYVSKTGLDCFSVHIQSALINMYGKCCDIESSVSLYEHAPRTLECCNSLMTALLHCGNTEDVVELFGLMVDEGIGLDEVTFSTTLKAVSMFAWSSSPSCVLLHTCAVKYGLVSEVAVLCSLIDGYARSGHIELARQIFDEVPSPNVFCFTSIINGHARNSMGRECVQLLEAMIRMGLIPDQVTFLCVLSGCNHSGMVEEGKWVFKTMKHNYGICPKRQHFSCMVDLLGRAGLLQEAENFLHEAPEGGDLVMWSSLLQNCRLHGNKIVGKRAAMFLMNLEPNEFAIYLLVSNFYSEIGEFEASMQAREIGLARKMTREIGCSSIEVIKSLAFASFTCKAYCGFQSP